MNWVTITMSSCFFLLLLLEGVFLNTSGLISSRIPYVYLIFDFVSFFSLWFFTLVVQNIYCSIVIMYTISYIHFCQDYQGHVFWDQETWMYPPIQVLHSDFGKTLIKSRIRTLDSAKKLAEQKGYKGAMYPWESAYTGKFISQIYLEYTYVYNKKSFNIPNWQLVDLIKQIYLNIKSQGNVVQSCLEI